MEEWRDIPGFPGYQVSSHGNVRCWRARNAQAKAPIHPRTVRPTTSHGYRYVSLSIDGTVSRKRVHRLVLEAFVGPCPDGMEARHVNDNDRANCRLDNLEWGTKVANQADRVRHGTDLRGEDVKASKLTAFDARRIYTAAGTHTAIAAEFGVSRKTVSMIKQGRAWIHATGAAKGAA